MPENAHTSTAEVTPENKDIGFVHTGQTAEIKFETFPYTKYGTVAAKVKVVLADGLQDEKRGSIIKTGKRRVIEYLLSPIQRAGSESLRER